jgi:hypothetical protein
MCLFYKRSYLIEEVNRTEPSPSVSVPCPLTRIYDIVQELKLSVDSSEKV